METEVKQRNQRNRRRERAQRMQAQRESKVKDGDSGEDESPARDKPPRPPARRKKSKEPLGEEDIIDGFAIMAFRTYEDLEAAVKCVSSPRTITLSTKPRIDVPRNHPSTITSQALTLLQQDAGTSDDSGRASERLTGSSVAPRDPDSSRDRLSDASSRCSSGKGYICDSEGDDDKGSPENSRNASPKYHDSSMEDATETGSLFRVTGAGGGGAAAATAGGGSSKSELVARGGSGGALALSRAPVGGSASPAPAPLPQPAPSPAPAALPPPALPPPPFRADTPHRPSGAHIPALDGQAATATQIPARPVGAAGPDTPERPASNNKLQPGARAAADSPTPAPPAPPAPSPLFPQHTAYQSHAAAAMPDYRHTNHEARTEPRDQASGPLDLHSARPPHIPSTAALPSHPSLQNRVPHPQPHPVIPGHDVRNATPASPLTSAPASFPTRVNGAPPSTTPATIATTNASSLPSSILPGRPPSPGVPASRPYSSLSIGSSHVNSSIPSSIHNHSIPYQNQSSLQKHSVQSVYTNRPPHLAPFTAANHATLNHIQPSTGNHPTSKHLSHLINSHSIMNHTNHLPSNHISAPTPNHIGPPVSLSLASTASTTIPAYTPNLKHTGMGITPLPGPLVPASLHAPVANHLDLPPTSGAPAVVTTGANSISHPNSHPLPPPVVDSRQPPSVLDSKMHIDSRLPMPMDTRPPPASSSEIPIKTEAPSIPSLASNGYPPPAVYANNAYPPLYAPYASTLQHSPYLPPAAASPRNPADARTSLPSSPLVAPKTPKGVRSLTPGCTGAGPHALSYSPRGPSPTRERESFSNISSLSRSTPASSSSAVISAPSLVPPLATSIAPTLAAPLAAPLPGLPTTLGLGTLGPLAPTPTTAPTPALAHSLAPVPTVPSISSSAKPPAHWGVTRPSVADRPAGFAPAPPLFGAPLAPPNPTPFSAESLFQSSPGADLLRRELDNRFLAAAGGAVGTPPGPGGRTELHHHQHQHTHVHQHPGHHPHAPHHPPHPPLHPGHHPPHPQHPQHPHQLIMPHQSSLFKDMGKMPSLYRTGLGLGYPYSSGLLHPAAPYVAPAPLTTYAPKPVVSAPSDPANKPPRPANAKTGKWNAMHVRIAWEIYNHQQKEKGGAANAANAINALNAANAANAEKDKARFSAPAPPPPYRSPYDLPPAPYLPHHPHLGVSPFARYGGGGYPGASLGFAAYGRELPLSSLHHPPLMHDAWRVRPVADDRVRREREERERREREERERRKQRERELERARTRSPLRNGQPEPNKEERKEAPRPGPPPPTLGAYGPPPWDPYRGFDPLQHMRFAPLMEAAIRAEEDRVKMLSAYHHQQLKTPHLAPLHRAPPLPPLHAPLSLAPPLAPTLAPLPTLPPLDLLKKEEPR